MPSLAGQILIGLVAYLAAGTYYVLRGLGEAGHGIGPTDLKGLAGVALCWVPITIGNLVSIQRSQPLLVLLRRFRLETLPPFTLFVAIIIVTSALLTS